MPPKKKSDEMDLITAVVRRSLADQALKAALDAGAPGITYFWARGTGVKEKLDIVGSLVEAEKQVLWVVTQKPQTQRVLDAIVKAANLNLPAEGFAYVQTVTQAVGFVPAGLRI
ncbi:MAG: P-II family nitrogen regulator [Elusimicrobia bacterium]|nr:P-II family nitrogen regulator [Elusimicrobiota bacterium]